MKREFFRLGLTADLARLVGRHPSTIRRWRRNGIPKSALVEVKKIILVEKAVNHAIKKLTPLASKPISKERLTNGYKRLSNDLLATVLASSGKQIRSLASDNGWRETWRESDDGEWLESDEQDINPFWYHE